MECLGLYKKPKADVHPGHKLFRLLAVVGFDISEMKAINKQSFVLF